MLEVSASPFAARESPVHQNAFPLPHVLLLKQTNAGRCHYSCSCALDTSQRKYLFLTLSPTSQKQAQKYKTREQSSSQETCSLCHVNKES